MHWYVVVGGSVVFDVRTHSERYRLQLSASNEQCRYTRSGPLRVYARKATSHY